MDQSPMENRGDRKEDAGQAPRKTGVGPNGKDSFGLDHKKSPWAMYALLQIPIVLIMVVILYVMYQFKNN